MHIIRYTAWGGELIQLHTEIPWDAKDVRHHDDRLIK